MAKFKCVLCFRKSQLRSTVALSRKVTEGLTLEDCIRRSFSCSYAILNSEESTKYSCNNCFTEFVKFYEFLTIVEANYEDLMKISIKTEPDDDGSHELDNFIDVSQIMHFNPYEESPVDQKQCSVDPELMVEVKEEKEIERTCDDNDSDFEWPLHNEEMFKTNDETDDNYNSRPASKTIHRPILNKVHILPANLMTPEILVHPEDFIVIDGVEYKIPRRKPDLPKPQEKLYRTNRRPHRFHDAEGEKRIAESVEVKCHECGEEMENFMRVRKHFKKFHKEQKGYLRCWCGERKFTRRYELLDHLDRHERKHGFKCQLCNNDKEYTTEKTLQSHINLVHLNIRPTMTYVCDHCGKICSNSSMLKDHQQRHEETKFECFICHASKATLTTLKNHMKHMHTKDGKYRMATCTICSKTLRKMYLVRHMKLHTEDTRNRIKCHMCDRWLLKQSMETHLRIHKNEPGGITCKICGVYLKNKYSISKHMRNLHDETQKKFACTHCDRKFYVAVKLKEHIAVHHTREFPWTCRVCGRQFRAECGWRVHEKKQHPEEYERLYKPAYLRPSGDVQDN